MSADPTALDAALAAHPELDAEAITDAYFGMENDPDDQPQPYEADEREAHQILLAYLQHLGTPDWDGEPGELSDRSRQALIEKVLPVTMLTEEGSDLAVVLRWEVFQELVTEWITLANLRAHANGEGNARDLLLRLVTSREVDHVGRAAWLADYGDG